MPDAAEVTKRLFEEAWNAGDLAVADELIAESAVNHDPANPEAGTGPEGFKDLVRMYRGGFPDLRFEVEDLVVADDRAVARWRTTGTHTGDLAGMPATGKQTSVTGITINRVEAGQVVETWSEWDNFGLMQQLGVAPGTEVGAGA